MDKKYIPRVGTKFSSREELLGKLEDAGWKYEGEGQGFSKGGKITIMDLGVTDEDNDLWLWIDMKPLKNGVKIVNVKKLKLSDYGEGEEF
jgi:hypothetical protein